VQKIIIQLLRSSTGPGGFLLLGMANGLLPCGMVYIALASTLSFGNAAESFGFMAMFGAGTLPAMMAVAYAGQHLRSNTRRLFQKAVPFFILSVGLLLLLRGMNLGIPFVSPLMPGPKGQVVVCHPATVSVRPIR
jgi:sulfite exporter TauE/SafE